MNFKELMDSTDIGEEITKATLKWHFNYMVEENQKLFKAGSLMPHQAQDYANNLKYMDAIKQTLIMFGVRL